jgi:hypothetical protein
LIGEKVITPKLFFFSKKYFIAHNKTITKAEIHGTREIRKYSNPTMVDYKHLKALKKIQESGSHLGMQLLMDAAHYDG